MTAGCLNYELLNSCPANAVLKGIELTLRNEKWRYNMFPLYTKKPNPVHVARAYLRRMKIV